MTPVPQANRQDQAARLRDVCLELVQQHGVRRTIGVHALNEVALEPFTIWFAEYSRMSSLDVWYDGAGRVLHLRLEADAMTIVQFQRGPWEEEFFELEPPSKAKGI